MFFFVECFWLVGFTPKREKFTWFIYFGGVSDTMVIQSPVVHTLGSATRDILEILTDQVPTVGDNAWKT